MSRLAISVALLLTLSIPAFAQAPELKPKKLTLKAAKAPVPALKYRLLPPASDLEPGNAMLCYMRALSPEMGRSPTEAIWDEYLNLDQTFEEFKQNKKFHSIAIPFRALEEVDRGARREYCDWEILPRLRKYGFGAVLPEIQPMRQWRTLLEYRARLEIMNHQFDKAAHTIQTMVANGRHTAEGPTMINSLVGIFLASMAMETVEELIQEPDSPNMYWALSTLPRPLIDIRKGFESERIAFEFHFSAIKEIENRRLTQQELDRLAELCWGNELSGGKEKGEVSFNSKMLVVGIVAQQYADARKALIDQGRTAKEIDDLPMFQVVLTHNYQQYRRVLDDLMKWSYLPYWEGCEASKQTETECRGLKMFPFGMLIPAMDKALFASVRPDRKVAVLRCIEAVRMHVAETGKVPATFDEIKIVPIPIDPVTGKQFPYKAVGDVVTIYGPPPPGVRANEGNVINYEITIKR